MTTSYNGIMKHLPLGIQTFSNLIDGGYLYIDKTKDIFRLFEDGGKYYFLSRPRRFGKSLLISTLKEMFSGNKELFKGLWIYDKITWDKHPVIHLDFLGLKYSNPGELNETLEFMLNQNARSYGIQLTEKGYDKQFNELIQKLSLENKVVILVDEYDKPIINLIDKPELASQNRDVLKTFYEVIKRSDPYLKFVFITGVSKFSKVSVFYGLNNLRDLTVSTSYATLLGYTQEELMHYFKDRIKEMKKESTSQLTADIQRWYNGYSWDGQNFVYNPFSILQFFQEKKFGNFWFSTGTPTFLLKMIREHHIDVKSLENYETTHLLFDSFDIDRINVFALLFQTGYLTIKQIKEVSRTQSLYLLSYPNQEVKESFLDYLAADFTGKMPNDMGYMVYKLKKSLEEDIINEFLELLKSVFASVPYDIFVEDREAYYHTIIYLLLMLIGIEIKTEMETNQGRIDAIIETSTHVYIMEFKMGDPADAIRQINEKKYYQPYLSSPKNITLIGVGFGPDTRNIKDFIIESLPR